jgi:hypothetical protein
MMLKAVYQRVVKWWWVAAVCLVLLSRPFPTTPVYAGECVPASSDNCT